MMYNRPEASFHVLIFHVVLSCILCIVILLCFMCIFSTCYYAVIEGPMEDKCPIRVFTFLLTYITENNICICICICRHILVISRSNIDGTELLLLPLSIILILINQSKCYPKKPWALIRTTAAKVRFNSFCAELFKVDASMLQIGLFHVSCYTTF